MEFDRREADDQFTGDLLVAEAFHHASQHLAFAFGQVSANFFGRDDPPPPCSPAPWRLSISQAKK